MLVDLLAEQLRQIRTFAASAGDTISADEAIALIRGTFPPPAAASRPAVSYGPGASSRRRPATVSGLAALARVIKKGRRR